jgi:putative beta-lysine N-acetyltransferase
MPDRMERIGDSLVQHGHHSERIYLMKVASTDCPQLVGRLDELAVREGYSKIFAKVPVSLGQPFLEDGYCIEARVPRFYQGREEGLLLGKFFCSERRIERDPALVRDVLAQAQAQAQSQSVAVALPEGFTIRPLAESEVEQAAAVYREVFTSYPFPIHDSVYLRQTLRDHVRYFGAWHQGRLAALSSAELDLAAGHAEMTDFATLPTFRGQGLALVLLQRMEEAIRSENIRTAYTIARAYSHGMNITFARAGYRFGGTLRNNTQICGRQESMNVWYKSLSRDV